MKRGILLLTLLSAMIMIQAQEGRHVIGVRLGLSSGISYEMKVDPFRSYKGLLTYREGGVQFTTLIESTRPLYLNFTDNLFYYAGIGAHVGFTRYQPRHGLFFNPFNLYGRDGRFAPVLGMDAIIGIEYRLHKVPWSFALDAKPFFELFGQNIFRISLFDIGFTIKYSF